MLKHKPQPTGMILVASYFVLFFINSFIVLMFNRLFPESYVLGTATIDTTWALIHAIGTFTLLLTFAIPFVHLHENNRQKMYSNTEWILAYFAINTAGIWLVTRFADNLGFGIASWVNVLFLAAVLDIFQGIGMMQLEKWRQELK